MPYLISYYVAGVLLALASARIHRSPIRQHLVRILIIMHFWPLLLFVAPEFLTKEPETATDWHNHSLDPVFEDLRDLAKKTTALTEEERRRLRRVAESEEEGTTFFADSTNFEDVLARFWDEGIPPEVYHAFKHAQWRLSREAEECETEDNDGDIRFCLAEPDWYIGLSAEFTKSIAKIDKNKRARVLEAIGKLAEAPTTPRGDTIKPLTGDLAGLWRYRIGDDRLMYRPNAQSKKVVLISFGARGGIYA